MKHKAAVITGAGSGIGRSAAERFAREGAKVVVVDVNAEGGRETVERIARSGGEAIYAQADVTRSSDVQAVISLTIGHYGRLDMLLNNAGCSQPLTLLEDVEEEMFDRVMRANVKSVFAASKLVIPIMKKQRSGVIINVSSLTALRPTSGFNVYAASKAAVVTLTKAMALELAPFQVRCNCICPTAVATPMLDAAGEKAKAAILPTIPMGRFVAPEEVAATALYLASDAAAMITGTAITLDGGRGI